MLPEKLTNELPKSALNIAIYTALALVLVGCGHPSQHGFDNPKNAPRPRQEIVDHSV